jgi:hypothetical protein
VPVREEKVQGALLREVSRTDDLGQRRPFCVTASKQSSFQVRLQ